MPKKRFFVRVLLLDYVLALLFCTMVTQATGMLIDANLDPPNEQTISVATMKETDTPTSTLQPTSSATPTVTTVLTATTAPTAAPKRRVTPTVEPTKAPYVFPQPFYTRERSSSASTGAMPTRSK